MPKASELRKGDIIEINGQPHAVRQIEARSPSSRGAATLYKIRFSNLQTGQKLDESCKGDDLFKPMDCQRRQIQFSYQEGDTWHFMDLEDYSQYSLPQSDIEEQIGYITEGLEGMVALLSGEQILGIELPQSVVLEIVETAPAIKGATATGRTKPARLASGVEVQVPEYLASGDLIKVNTQTGKFMSRV